MGNEECTEIRVWDAVGQGRISGGGTEGGKVVEVPPLWSVPGHDDTVVCLGVIGGEGLVSSGYDRTVRLGGRERGKDEGVSVARVAWGECTRHKMRVSSVAFFL